MRFVNFAVVKFSVFLVFGILSAHYFPISYLLLKYVLASIAVLVVLWWYARKRLQQQVFFGLLAYCCFYGIGYLNYQLQLPEFQEKHYVHYLKEKAPQLLQLKIKEVLKPDLYSCKYIAEVNSINNNRVEGKALVYFQKDSLSHLLKVDDELLVSSEITPLPQPINPNQFNYTKYMGTLGVIGQIKTSEKYLIKKTEGTKTLRGQAERFRQFAIKKLSESNIKPSERAIIYALILGERKSISKETFNNYAAAGAIHILAVSGLHIGILFLMLSFILRPVERIKRGKLLKSLLIVIALWAFAFIAGGSPSVIRAVTMFSFFTFAQNIDRPTNSINTLFLSFFVLLLFNPMWLFHVGFQLSYLAVFFILWIQPKLVQYYRPRFYLDKLLWDIFTVSIAAQIGIAPLSLYYFHQFPGLFFISNLVVLPFLGILLGGGIIVVICSLLGLLPNWLSECYAFLIQSLNVFISWVAQQEDYLFKDISFSEVKAITWYLFITITILVWKRFNYKRLVFGLCSILLLISVEHFERNQRQSSALIIFHRSKHTLIGYRNGRSLRVLKKSSRDKVKNEYPIKSYRIANGIEKYSEEILNGVFRYRDMRILVMDSLGLYSGLSGVDLVILTQSPKINLERLIDSLQPKQIVADGSNYHSYVDRWRKTSRKKKLPFHHTGTKGAFLIE